MQTDDKASKEFESFHSQRRDGSSPIGETNTYCVILLGVVPCFEQAVAHRVCCGLISSHVVEVESGARQSVLDVIDDGSLDGLLVGANVGAHQLPHLFLPFVGWLAKLWPVQGR